MHKGIRSVNSIVKKEGKIEKDNTIRWLSEEVIRYKFKKSTSEFLELHYLTLTVTEKIGRMQSHMCGRLAGFHESGAIESI